MMTVRAHIGISVVFMMLVFGAAPSTYAAKPYKGAEYRTKASFLYGKFEVRLKAIGREGILASFFTYNDTYPTTPWNEIDIEILGRYTDDVQFNTITPGQTNHVSHQYVNFNPALDYHIYGFEWTPEYVAWFIDTVEVFRQTGSHVATLNIPQKIMMNVWNPTASNWAGRWNEAVLPAFAYYDWVRYSSYTPGSGQVGTGKNFTLQWTDNFDSWDQTRWDKATHTFGGNGCDFLPDNAVFQDGKLVLCLTKDNATGYTDGIPPTVLWARAEKNSLRLMFSEEVGIVTAESIGNYIIPGATVAGAHLQPDQRTVLLDVPGIDTLKPNAFMAQNISDRWSRPNTLATRAFQILQQTPLTFPVKINVGGGPVQDFLADQMWDETKEYGRMDGEATYKANTTIVGTADQEVYRNELYDLCEYKVRVPRGRYLVVLMMAENYFNTAGQRRMSYVVEGIPVETNLDLVSRVGFRTAYSRNIFVDVLDDVIDIHAQGVTDKPLLNGLVIAQVSTGLEGNNSTGENGLSFSLEQNYPNPFNGRTSIRFTLPQDDWLTLRVFDSLGRTVSERALGAFRKGESRISWDATTDDGRSLASGVYYYGLCGEHWAQTRKMIYLK